MPAIIPIKDLKDTAAISDMCHRSEEPIYVTKNGYGDMVIMSMQTYEDLMKQVNLYKELELSENQITKGKIKDAKVSLDALRSKYDL